MKEERKLQFNILIMENFMFVYIILIHFLADFALQTHEQAQKKSTDNKMLIYHVLIYSLIWWIACIATHEFTKFDGWDCILFTIITFVFHFATDYVTSRINKSFFDKQDYHNGFLGVGFDQMLHYLQLYFTFKLLL